MDIIDSIENEVNQSFVDSLHDILIFCEGYLAGDSEHEELLNFVNFLLHKEK